MHACCSCVQEIAVWGQQGIFFNLYTPLAFKKKSFRKNRIKTFNGNKSQTEEIKWNKISLLLFVLLAVAGGTGLPWAGGMGGQCSFFSPRSELPAMLMQVSQACWRGRRKLLRGPNAALAGSVCFYSGFYRGVIWSSDFFPGFLVSKSTWLESCPGLLGMCIGGKG